MPALTIILSSYNRPQNLRQSIESVLAQTYRDRELIVCDDGSTSERVHDILDEFSECPGVRILQGPTRPLEEKQRRCTLSTLINCALQDSHSRFVSYLGDGTTYYPTRCERFVAYLEAHETATAAWGHQDVVTYDWEGRMIGQRRQTVSDAHEVWRGQAFVDRLRGGNFIDHSSVVEHRVPIAWDEDGRNWWYPDWIRWQEMARAGYEFHFLPSVVGECKQVTPHNIGLTMARGGSIADVLRERDARAR